MSRVLGHIQIALLLPQDMDLRKRFHKVLCKASNHTITIHCQYGDCCCTLEAVGDRNICHCIYKKHVETCGNVSSLETVGFLVLHAVPRGCPLQMAEPRDPPKKQRFFPPSSCSWASGTGCWLRMGSSTALCSSPASDFPMGKPGCFQSSATSPACICLG